MRGSAGWALTAALVLMHMLKSPVTRIDLTSEHGLLLVWRMLEQHNVVVVHLGPPCGA